MSIIQQQILRKAIESPSFSKDVLPQAPMDIFGDNQLYKEIATIVKRYYQTNRNTLTEEALLTIVEDKLDRSKTPPEQQQEYFNTVNELYDVRDSQDDDVIDERIENYIRKHMRMDLLKDAAMNLDDEEKMENFDKRFREIMLLSISGKDREIVNVIDDSDYKKEALSSLQKDTIPVGFKSIDDLNGGGLAKGEVGLIVAASGTGKCITGDSLITTCEGLIPIEDIPHTFSVDSTDDTVNAYVASYTEDGKYSPTNTSHWYNLGKNRTLKVTLSTGQVIEGTPEHPLLVEDSEGLMYYKELQDFTTEEYVVLSKGADMWAEKDRIKESDFEKYSLQKMQPEGVPTTVLQSSKRIIVKYLTYMYNKNGSVTPEGVELRNLSFKESQHIQSILLNLGIESKSKPVLKSEKQGEYSVTLNGVLNLHVFHEYFQFPFEDVHENNKLYNLYNLFYYPLRERSGLDDIEYYLREETSVAKVVDIQESSNIVYDFTVPETHSFVANGIISHNTLILTNVATNYVKQGYNVLFVALEEMENRMILRFEQSMLRQNRSSILTGSELNEDNFNKFQDFYQRRRDRFGNLFFARYSPHTVTPAKLEQLISDVTLREGVDVDVVVVDYPELLRNPNATGNESDDGGKLFEEIRRIGQDYNVVTWTAAQMNRTAYGALVRTSEHMEGSHRKKNAVELVLTVNQTPEEFKAGYIRTYADKVRNVPDGGFDRMLGFRVIGEQMTMRDYRSEEERQTHQQVLEEADNRIEGEFKGKKKKKDETPIPDAALEMNKAIQSSRGQ